MERVLTTIAVLCALLVGLGAPTVYFAVRYQSEKAEVETELENQSHAVTTVLARDAGSWSPGSEPLLRVLSLRPWDGDAERRSLSDMRGNTIALSEQELSSFTVTMSLPVFDTGKQVGSITIERDMWPVYEETGFVALVSALLALGIFAVMRVWPLRTLHETVELLVQERAKGREFESALEISKAAEEQQRLHSEAMARQQATLMALIDAIPDLISYKDTSGRYLGCNAAFAADFGISKEELMGRLDVEILSPESAARSREMNRELLETLKPSRSEEWTTMADGRRALMDVNRAPFFAADGTVIGLFGIGRDVTLARQTEAELMRAKEMAEDATLMKSQFLANMSHEIRTPMNAVLGLSHLLLKTELTPRQRDFLKKLESSGQHLMGLLNDILDFSKVEAGKMDIERAEFELTAVLDNVTNLISERCSAKGLELIVDVAPDLPRRVIGDSLRVGQVLLNLAGNAVKFTEHGEVVIAVRLDKADADGLMIRFSVTDSGMGMSEEQCKGLFESFHQVDSSTTRRFGGSGLGLAIAKKLSTLMGGDVGVTSTVGRGSTFWFTARMQMAVPAMDQASATELSGRRALVVDDNDVARTVIAGMLQSMNLEVMTASSGKAAIDAVSKAAAAGRPFDVLYVDWRMPGMDGVETTRRIRDLNLATAPCVVMVTAFDRDELVRACPAANIPDVLVKPVSAANLRDATRRALAQLGHPEEREAADPSPERAGLADIAGARVLLVEDNDINQIVASEILMDAGLVVDVAGDGAEALRMVKQRRYDIVLMDMQMPVMDGIEATIKIRQDRALDAMPIVAMTANAMEHDRQRCLRAGMNDFVSKPFEPEELWRVLVQWTPVQA